MKQFKRELAPTPVDAYEIHPDGGLIYNPLSREAEKLGELHKYDASPKIEGEIAFAGGKMTYRMPASFTAYDLIPIEYTIACDQPGEPVHVEANCIEESSKKQGRALYDCTLPGRVSFDFEYLGYLPGYNHISNRPNLSASMNEDRQGTKYPHYDLGTLTRSGVVESSPYTWFRFAYTYTGNTVLDGDGGGTFSFAPVLMKKNEAGQFEDFTLPCNIFYRIFDTVYPGERNELWITFEPYPGYQATKRQLDPGEYRIRLECVVRNEIDTPNWMRTIWSGEPFCTAFFDFTVEDGPRQCEPLPIRTEVKEDIVRNGWLHTYEEFQTSFDSWLKPERSMSGTLFLQCAPWAKEVTLKVIVGNGDTLAAAVVPVEVESDSIHITLNQEQKNFVLRPDGTRFPMIMAQSMADMRGNTQLGPYADGNILQDLFDMRDCGINCLTTTAAFEYDGSHGTAAADCIDAFWFLADAMREMGIRMEGVVTYPYIAPSNVDKAQWEFGVDLQRPTSDDFSSHDLAVANGLKSKWEFQRWGDNYWMSADGIVPLSIEDSRGWMRIDLHNRHPLGAGSMANFRTWLREKYGTIDRLNQAWGSEYESFDVIDPEEGCFIDHLHGRNYTVPQAALYEWSIALKDLDEFRTLERVENYKTMLSQVSDVLPTARFNLRTEGGNWLVTSPHDTPNQRLRHIYYSQRRVAMMPEIMQQSGTLYAHSDYVTLPYSPSEVYELTCRAVREGVMPMHLAQFDRMRDIAINEKYGEDYKVNYNLSGPATRGAYISTTISLFTWFKAIYEGGGVPGLLWQDYLCDGYATETQRREIRFFTDKLEEMLSTPEGERWAREFTPPDESVLATSRGRYSYPKEMVADLVRKFEQKRREALS